MYIKNSEDSNFAAGLLKQLDKLGTANSKCVELEQLSAEIRLNNREYKGAKKNLLSLFSYDKKSLFASFYLGKVYHLEQKYDSAIFYYDYAAKLKARNGVVIDKTMEYYNVTGEQGFDIRYGEIIFQKALSCYSGKYFWNAYTAFKYCATNRTKVGESYFYIGLLFLETSNYESVCEYMKLAKENGFEKASTYILSYCNHEGSKK